MEAAQIALNRFGLGGRPGEAPPADPRGWLTDQIAAYDSAPPGFAGLPDTTDAMAYLFHGNPDKPLPQQMEMVTGCAGKPKELFCTRKAFFTMAASARMTVAAASSTPFAERLAFFWSNHFAVSVDKVALDLAGPFERDAIRPHVMGRFSDMLNAVERHPAMLLFLDQQQSIGPDSMALSGHKPNPMKRPGLNENLAREIMELHTLGVRSGYTQADVTEFARALTGWGAFGLGRLSNVPTTTPGKFMFSAELHEPGARTIMGKRYAQPGEGQAQAVLDDLAAHPATARHIATKLARHFAGDDPPPALVDKLARTFTSTGGDLPSVYRALIDAPEAWTPAPVKFREPWDWLVAVLRGTDVPLEGHALLSTLDQLGQPTWKPGSPAGWDDFSATWAAPDALMRRVDFASTFAPRAASLDARALGQSLFGPSLSDATRQTVDRAASPAQALTLLLVSPEMLRR